MTTSMDTIFVTVLHWRSASRAMQILTSVLLLSGCTSFSAPRVASETVYVLEAQRAAKPAQVRRNLVLAISEPTARPGFDTPQMAYVLHPHELSYFVTSRWADQPAHMLEPLLVQAMEQSGSFRAVVQVPGAVPADIRLDTELIRLLHDFVTRPSRVQLTLRAQLIDLRGQRILAVKEFDESENAASENAYGGVTAANRALLRVLDQLVAFCVQESDMKGRQ
jgi:cholesterol transport system auxiliary component